MDSKFYHGNIEPKDIADALHGHFNRNNLDTKEFGTENRIVVQIATHINAVSGGGTAIPITIEEVPDGVSVQIGKQSILGVAASLSFSAFAAFQNPLNLLSRIDDIAQDIENLQLKEDVWQVIDRFARQIDATLELSENLRTITCAYCKAANPISEPNCVACGAPMGELQPGTCKACGFVIHNSTSSCPNCGAFIVR